MNRTCIPLWIGFLAALFVLGCPSPKPPVPPTPPPLTVVANISWKSDGAAAWPYCSASVLKACKKSYVVRDETVNSVLAIIPVVDSTGAPIMSDSIVVPTSSVGHTISFAVNAVNFAGASTEGPRAQTVLTR